MSLPEPPPGPAADPDPNPFAAPDAELVAPDAGRRFESPEAFRRAFIGHETAVKLVRVPAHILAFLGVIGLVVAATEPVPRPGVAGEALIRMLAGSGPMLTVLTVACLVLGYGIRRLRAWSRWAATTVALGALVGAVAALPGAALEGDRGRQLLFVAVVLMASYVIFVMTSSRSTVVFSKGYRSVVPKTPRVRPTFGEVIGPVGWLSVSFAIGVAAAIAALRRAL